MLAGKQTNKKKERAQWLAERFYSSHTDKNSSNFSCTKLTADFMQECGQVCKRTQLSLVMLALKAHNLKILERQRLQVAALNIIAVSRKNDSC